MNESVTDDVLLKTATEKPRDSILSTKFWPITARPMKPKSYFAINASLLIRIFRIERSHSTIYYELLQQETLVLHAYMSYSFQVSK